MKHAHTDTDATQIRIQYNILLSKVILNILILMTNILTNLIWIFASVSNYYTYIGETIILSILQRRENQFYICCKEARIKMKFFWYLLSFIYQRANRQIILWKTDPFNIVEGSALYSLRDRQSRKRNTRDNLFSLARRWSSELIAISFELPTVISSCFRRTAKHVPVDRSRANTALYR